MRRGERRDRSVKYPPPDTIRHEKIGFLKASAFVSCLALLMNWGLGGWGSNPFIFKDAGSAGFLLVFFVFGVGLEYVPALLRPFAISSERIRFSLYSIPWTAVVEAHIERDYSFQSLLSKLPRWKVTFYDERGRRLGGFKLDESKGAKPEDYVLVYEALLANLGYPPEPGSAEPPGHCTPDPSPAGVGFGAF
jgi:hypothetical protein